jgi:voltage-gated potassium channel
MPALRIPLFRHDSREKIVWDVFMLALVLWSSLLVPYRILSGVDRFDIWYWLITAAFCMDILVSFNSTIKLRWHTITDRGPITRRYLATWFIPDLLAAFPFAALAVLFFGADFTTTKIFQVLMFLRLLRLLKVFKAQDIFRVLQDTLNVNPSIIRLCLFLFWFALLTHFLALGWLLIGAGDPSGDFRTRYVRALYWCMTTVTTIGYGDITPDRNSIPQMVYTIFVQLLGVGMFGYIIGNIASMMANMDVAKAAFQKKMEDVKNFMRVRRIPKDLQNKVKDYYHYLWEKQRSADRTSFVEELPHTLGTDLSLFLNRAILEKVSLFKDADEIFIREVVRLLEPVIYLPGDFIIQQGEYGDRMYFLNAGEVEVLVHNKKVAALGSGSFFGETALIQNERRTASIRTLNYCEVYVLTKDRFDALRTKYTDFDRKISEMMAARIKDTKEKSEK